MLINKTYFIDSCNDVELNIKRESKLEYRITYDDSKEMKAIVFILDGYGANVDLSVIDFTRQFIAQKFDVVAVSVLYHCFCQRKSNMKNYSAVTTFLEDDLLNLKLALEKLNINTGNLNTHNAWQYYGYLNQTISSLKEQNLLNQDYKVHLTAAFIPPNNEYQNYGIMASVDVMNALKDIIKNYPQFKSLPKIYGGLSYGGYLALMCAKIAPWYVDGVIDNSGEALLLLNYIIGRDLNLSDCVFYENNFIINTFLKTYWTRDLHST
ncbi:DUF2920 family protein, partial [Campylobacter volucris]|uniref:DUF2920 family protein n=1 Tax=Campylobacter volucris TaxID=1031542 RepID=UPI00189C9890